MSNMKVISLCCFAIILSSCTEKEPEELIELRGIAMEAINNGNVKKLQISQCNMGITIL